MTAEERIAELRRIATELRSIREGLAGPFARVRAADGEEVWRCRRATTFRQQLDVLERRTTGSGLTSVAGGIEAAEQLCALQADALEHQLAVHP